MAPVLLKIVAVRQAHASTEDEAVQADIVSHLPTTDGMTMPVPLTVVDAARASAAYGLPLVKLAAEQVITGGPLHREKHSGRIPHRRCNHSGH